MTSTVSDLHQPKTQELVCFPASFAQQRLWFIDQLNSGRATYNLPSALRVRGKLDIGVLERTLQEVARRHETLRTRFVAVDGEPQQVIEDQVNVQLPMLDLTGVAGEEEREAEAMRLSQEEARTPFNLKQAPLFRGKLLRLGPMNHVLLFTMHHIISDAWSMGVLIEEVSVLYDAFSGGRSSPLPELPIQYADYTVWQREWLEGAVLEQQLAYWKQQLGRSNILQLPADRPRPTAKSQNGATCDFVLGASLTQKLKKLADEQGATLFMVLLAAFQTLLYRYSGQHDIAVGTPTAGRSSGETEKLIGFFINTLVLRGDMSGAPSFTELLERTKEVTLEAYAHEDVPFERLVEVLSPERNLGSTPLFQVMIILQNTPQSDLRLGTVTLQPFHTVHNGTSKFDLSLSHAEEETGKLAGSIEYDTDLFQATTVQRMVRHYSCLIASVISAPETPIASLAILSPEERGMLLRDFNATAGPISEKTVMGFFEEQVERTPAAIAVRCEGATLTYSELDTRANQLGHYLKEMGVGPEMRVGICLNRGLDMIVALLGVLKAGGAYVPMDPSSPVERLRFMLEQAQIPVLVTESSLRGSLPRTMVQLVSMDEDWKDIAANSTTRVEGWIDSTNLAYVIYTSGSTGQPKGVAVTHQGMVNYVNWAAQAYQTSQGTGSPLHSSLAFDLTVTSIYPALLNGGYVEVLSQGAGIEELAQQLESSDYSLLKLTPSHLRMLSLLLETRKKGEHGARVLVIGGEALKYADLELWRTGDAKTRLINEYGPTETVVGSTIYEVQNERQAGDVPVGQPIVNTQIYILDADMQPVPIGVPGELFIAGAGLAREYVNRSDLTAERFLANPYGEPGTRMYRTGDLARWRQDGNLEYFGRNDHQVKIHGFRIEPGEIEAVLQEHAGVQQALVIVREDESGEKQLVAYVVPEQMDEKSETINGLREHLLGKLPEYMMPAAYVQLEKIPLNQNGKIDTKNLPQPGRQKSEQEYIAPRNATEEMLCRIWQDVLRREHVGIHDNFFNIGGHSLMATQVITRIRSGLNADIPLRRMFDSPTIAQLAGLIDQTTQSDGSNGISLHRRPAIKRVARKAALLPVERIGSRQSQEHEVVFFPASYAQQSLWFIDQLTPGKATYNIPSGLRIRGTLVVWVLKKTLEEVARRHETLRTRFVAVSGEPQQVIEDEVTIELPVLDLTYILDEQEREAKAVRLARAEAQTSFNLSQAPLFRAKLLRLGALDHMLLFTMHHIVSDAWSAAVLIEEVSVLYDAFSAGKPSPLPELSIQYADYSMWQREWLEGGALEQQLTYWKQKLRGTNVLELPTDWPRPASKTQNGAIHDFVVDANLTKKLKKLAEEQGATLFMVLLAAFQTLLYRYTGQDDIAVGTPTAGRSSDEMEKLIGFFINTLVLRVELSRAPSFIELLQRAKEVTLEAYSHQDIPFEQLVEVLSPERNLGSTPLFQVMIVLQNAPQSDLRLGAAELQPFNIADNGTSKFDLLLTAGEDGTGKMAGSLQYNTDLFAAASVGRMIDHYRVLLIGIVTEPYQSIGVLPLLTTEEHKQVIEEWNRTTIDFPREQCIPDLIEKQVVRTPEAVAVVYERVQLRYHELNARANQLAWRLKELGVGPETRVGLMVERSVEMLVGVLGVLKAGAAYVPLDPDYPPERLRYMLESAQVPVLLVQKHLREQLPSYGGQVLELDGDEERGRMAEQKRENPEVALLPEHPAYIIYTSGSTGRPKGVMNTHGGLLNRLLWMQQEYQLQPADVVLQKTPFSFDVSVWEFLWPLMEGAKLVVARPGGHQDPGYLATLINEQQITTLHFVPSMLSVFLDEERLKQCRSLRRLMCSGEALSAELARRCLAGMPWAELHNLYGPTEAAIDVTCWKCMGEDSYTSVPIGKPIANMRVYVVDERMEPAPLRVPGELCLAGVGLARGYWGRGDLTAERFVPDGLSGRRGERLYRTGDLVRWLEDGNLEYLGRLDHQVKIRGFRIELGEIEAALQEHGSVHQAVVIAREDEGNDKRLVAYVVAEPDKENKDQRSTEGLWTNQLREHLQAKLPEYMVPALFVQLHELPLNANGKIDRRALAEISTKEMRGHEGYVAPRTPQEKFLAELWADILRVERVGIHDHFFRLGGHSLNVIQVLARIREGLSLELPVKAIFEQPTIAGLVKKLQDAGEINNNFAPPPIARCSRKDPLPLSFAQQRLWFLDQIEPGSRVHHIPTLLRLKGVLNIDALSAALDEIVRRHEILRTSFPTVDGHPYQKISPPGHVLIEKIDLRDVPQEFREENLRRLADLHIQKAFDLAQGPMFRVALYMTEEQEHVLCLTVHHIICDAWSVPIFIRELNVLYNTSLNHGRPPLPDLPLQYADVAAWEREWLRDEVLEHHVRYWQQTLEGAPQFLDLPTDFPRPSVRSLDAGRRTLCLPSQLYSELKKLSQKLGVTEFMTLLALMNVWLFRYTGQSDVLIGTPVSNRTQLETEGLIGIFLNTIVFRTRFDAQLRFTQLVDQVRLNAVGAYAHQALPFEKLVEELHVVRDPGKNPVFQVMFNMLAGFSDKLEFAGLVDNQAIEVDAGQARFDLHLNAVPTPAGLELALTYNCGLFQQSTVTSMLETFAELVRVITENPEMTIAELVETAVRFEQESALARKRGHSQQQAQQLRTVRRRAAMNESR